MNEHVELDFIEIPPLLIQPYVENAIWHGLMHKEDGGCVFVSVDSIAEESIDCSNRIKDNGVGRMKICCTKSKDLQVKIFRMVQN